MKKSLWYGLIYFGTIVLVLGIDRLTKLWAIAHCKDAVKFSSFLWCELTYNYGMSWGIFPAKTTGALGFTLLLISLVIGYITYIAWQRVMRGNYIFGELLVIAGALSNSFDRCVYGAVVDFILVGYGSWYWPIFNVADIAIVFGVSSMILEAMREPADV